MPAVDYERVMVRLKAHIASKPSHGQRELFETIINLEVDCEIPEGQDLFDDRPLPTPRAQRPHTEEEVQGRTEESAASHA